MFKVIFDTETTANEQVDLFLNWKSNFSSFYALKQLETITNNNSSGYTHSFSLLSKAWSEE